MKLGAIAMKLASYSTCRTQRTFEICFIATYFIYLEISPVACAACTAPNPNPFVLNQSQASAWQ